MFKWFLTIFAFFLTLIWTFVCWLVGCLTSQQHMSVSQGRVCSDNFMYCHTEIEVANPTFYLTQSQNTDTGPTSPSTDPIMPGVWYDSTLEKSRRKRDSNPGSSALEADAVTIRPTRRSFERCWDLSKLKYVTACNRLFKIAGSGSNTSHGELLFLHVQLCEDTVSVELCYINYIYSYYYVSVVRRAFFLLIF